MFRQNVFFDLLQHTATHYDTLHESVHSTHLECKALQQNIWLFRWNLGLCCTVLQCVAVCGRVLQGVAVCCSVLQCVAVSCSVLQCVAECCSVLQCAADQTQGSWDRIQNADLYLQNTIHRSVVLVHRSIFMEWNTHICMCRIEYTDLYSYNKIHRSIFIAYNSQICIYGIKQTHLYIQNTQIYHSRIQYTAL